MELPTRDEGKEKKAGDRSAWHKSLDDIEMIKRKERRKQTATAVYLNQPVCKIDGWNRLVTFDLETSRSTYEGYPQTSLSGISRERERKTGFCRGVSFLEILVSFHRVRVIRRILKRLPMIHRPNENSRLLLSGSPLWITATRDPRGSRERFGCFVTSSKIFESTFVIADVEIVAEICCHESFSPIIW